MKFGGFKYFSYFCTRQYRDSHLYLVDTTFVKLQYFQ
nr:MAG TPA: hypothetical protein [Caudoviricetes sp.]